MKAKVGVEFKHKNFYETIDEAHRRLLRTVVLYDGEPVEILTITNHKMDGIFRVYFIPCLLKGKAMLPNLDYFPVGSAEQAAMIDKWLEENKSSGVERKQMNSPKFNKFRPFPLGMIVNSDGRNAYCYYLQRSPERRTFQGLTQQAIVSTQIKVSVTPEGKKGAYGFHLAGPAFVDCVKGNHPTAEEVLENMMDPKNANNAVPCHRDFAIVRGPLDTFFLGYKDEIIGFVPRDKRPQVELAKKFAHLKETVEETRQFRDIRTRN